MGLHGVQADGQGGNTSQGTITHTTDNLEMPVRLQGTYPFHRGRNQTSNPRSVSLTINSACPHQIVKIFNLEFLNMDVKDL